MRDSACWRRFLYSAFHSKPSSAIVSDKTVHGGAKLQAQAGGRDKDMSSANAGHVRSMVARSSLKTLLSGYSAQRAAETYVLKASALNKPCRILSAS